MVGITGVFQAIVFMRVLWLGGDYEAFLTHSVDVSVWK